MTHMRRTAKVNLKMLVIILVAAVVLVAGAFAARHIRRSILMARDLEEGTTAFDQKNWKAACTSFQEYLERNPDNADILEKYATASLLVRPLAPKNISAAVGAYQRLLRLDPNNETACERLATLYGGVKSFADLAYIARKRLETAPNDPKALLWLAKGLVGQQKDDEAKVPLNTLVSQLSQQAEKHPEYVEACSILAFLSAKIDSPEGRAGAASWLDRAVKYNSQSPEARLYRARFLRFSRPAEGQTREKLLAAARVDLEAVDILKPEDPRIRLALCEEWMAHGNLKQAAIELDATKGLDDATVDKYFVDPADLAITRFLLASKLSLQKDTPGEVVAPADEVLIALKDRPQRILVLPSAIQLYVAVAEKRGADAPQRTADARRCLDDYLTLARVTQRVPEPREKVAYLQARVAKAEDKPYRVIEILEPVTAQNPLDSTLLRLQAEAYSITDQPRRSIRSLTQYIKLQPRDPAMTLQLAREYLKLRDWNRALQTARLAEPLDPTDIIIKLLRIEANVYVAAERSDKPDTRQLDALSAELADLRKSHPDNVDIRLLQAIVAMNKNDLATAEKELNSAIKECKQTETLRPELQLARLHFRAKRIPEAIEVCRASCQRHPLAAAAWEALAEMQQANEKPDEAQATLEKGVATVTDRWEKRSVTLKLAVFHILQGRQKAGIDLLKGLTEKDPHEVYARSILLSLPDVAKDEAAAQKLVDEVRVAEGENGLTWRLRQASLWLSKNDWRTRQQDIAGYLGQCINADPEWSAPTLLLGRMHEQLGNLDRAEEIYRRALSSNPSATDIADRLMSLLERQSRFPEAMQVLDKLDANTQIVSARRVRVAIGAGDFNQAINELKLRVASDAKDAESRILLARLIYWESKNVALASKYLDEAEAITPKSMAITAVRVSIMKSEGRQDDARKALDAEITRNPTFWAYFLRAAYLASLGDAASAEKDFVHLTTFKDEPRAYELLSKFYLDQKRVEDAIAVVQKGIEAYPEALPLKRDLMRMLFVRGAGQDRQQAADLLKELEVRLPDDPGLLWMHALVLLGEAKEESTRKAQELLERAVRLEATLVEGHLALVDLAMLRHDYAAARDLAIRALGSNPDSPRLLLARASAERLLNNPVMARELARAALKNDPDNLDAHTALTDIAIASRDTKALGELKTVLDAAIVRKPDADRLYLMRAALLDALGQTEAAGTSLEAFVQSEAGRRSTAAILALAEVYRVRGDAAKSAEKIKQAAAISPDNPEIVREQVLWLGTQKKLDEIVALTSAYRAQKTRAPNVMMTAASILVSLGSAQHHKEALALYEQTAADAPQLVSARMGLALLLYKMGDLDRAEQLYGDILAADPKNVQALNDLAWILAEGRKNYKTALELASRGIALAPDDIHLRDTRGYILMNLPNRMKDACQDFEKQLELAGDGPRRAKALLQLGRARAKMGEHLEAKRHLDEALKIDQKTTVFTAEERIEINRLIQGTNGKG